MINLRTRSGACKVISCTTMPPIEKPNRSTCFRPSALMKGDGVGGHLLERPRVLAGAAGYAGVVEQDHLTVASQAIRHRRVPIIHGADVVLAEDERHSSGLAEAAIGEADAVGLYELWRRGLAGMHRNTRSFVIFLESHPAFAQSTSFCIAGVPLRPIAPTTSPFTLMGNPPPHAATYSSTTALFRSFSD